SSSACRMRTRPPDSRASCRAATRALLAVSLPSTGTRMRLYMEVSWRKGCFMLARGAAGDLSLVNRASRSGLSQLPQPVQVLRDVPRGQLVHAAHQRLVHRRDADEAEDVALQAI